MRGIAKLGLILGGCTLIGAALSTPFTLFGMKEEKRAAMALRGTIVKPRMSHEEVASAIPSMMMDTSARATIIIDGRDGVICGVLRTDRLRGAREFIMTRDDRDTTLLVNLGSDGFSKRWKRLCHDAFIR
jgi:hypothetical protein